MAGLLIAGGAFATQKAFETDKRYIALAMFPILIGLQQFMEGAVWMQAQSGDPQMTRNASLAYLFFVWLIWPVWVPYMTAQLEHEIEKQKRFLNFAFGGLLLGLFLYLPNFWQVEWLQTEIIYRSIAYQCTLLSDPFISQELLFGLYLLIVASPPLLSSHKALRMFGASLIAFVPVTYFFFAYAHVSVLCFFAAMITPYIIYIILNDKCKTFRMEMAT